jgi:hypothetical protein
MASTVLADANRGSVRRPIFWQPKCHVRKLDGAMRKSRQPRRSAANSTIAAAHDGEAAARHSKFGSGNFTARRRKQRCDGPATRLMASS